MTYSQRHKDIDPDVTPSGFALVLDDDNPNAPNDAFVIGADMEQVRAPDANSYVDQEAGPKPWVKPVALVLALACVALTVWNLTRLAQGAPPPPLPTAFQFKQALYLGVMKIDAYQRVHGVVPQELADAGLLDAGPYIYERLGDSHYRMTFANNGLKLVYDSGDPKESFFGSPKEILTMGGSK